MRHVCCSSEARPRRGVGQQNRSSLEGQSYAERPRTQYSDWILGTHWPIANRFMPCKCYCWSTWISGVMVSCDGRNRSNSYRIACCPATKEPSAATALSFLASCFLARSVNSALKYFKYVCIKSICWSRNLCETCARALVPVKKYKIKNKNKNWNE